MSEKDQTINEMKPKETSEAEKMQKEAEDEAKESSVKVEETK